MRRRHFVALAGVLAAVIGVTIVVKRPKPIHRLAVVQSAFPSREPELKSYVQRNQASKDRKVQDRVGAAKIRIAYADAGRKDWKAARAVLLDTVKTYKGEGKMSDDFGGVPDQAAYQAAICLIADGRKNEGEAELVKFMRDWPQSPLVTAAYRRIGRLHGGTTSKEEDTLLQKDLDLQQSKIAFETSVCGPKCVQALMPLLGKAKPDLQEVAKRCGMTQKGTSCEGLRKGLLTYGIASYPYDLSASDFSHVSGPAILVRPNHYVVLEKIEASRAFVYDPRTGERSSEDLPTDPNTPIQVILFSPLSS